MRALGGEIDERNHDAVSLTLAPVRRGRPGYTELRANG